MITPTTPFLIAQGGILAGCAATAPAGVALSLPQG